MSTGKRLAKRSIIGTRVCAQGIDGLWYSGVIQTVDTPSSSRENNNCINITPNTKYTVRFDTKDMARRGPKKEFREGELIGPGFRNIMGVSLRPGQKIFITYNGRESAGEVLKHDITNDEVNVLLKPIGYEADMQKYLAPLELKKRLEEVRLLESRRSARLADQDRDTDFARLADMGSDRRRTSHSIDVPFPPTTAPGSRKRRPSNSQDDICGYHDDEQMDECNAALVLMSLSCSPHSPQAGQWNTVFGSSPGSNSTWSSGSSSPPLSDDGKSSSSNERFRTSSISTSDEGIVMDYNDDIPKKRRTNNNQIFKCTWKGCGVMYGKKEQIVSHVRKTHLGPKKPRQSIEDDDGSFSDSDHEEEFYYEEIEDEPDTSNSPSPPTLSHRDMARPPHEDPEYQRQIVGSYRQGLLALNQTHQQQQQLQQLQQQQQQQLQQQQSPVKIQHQIPVTLSPVSIPNHSLVHHNYTWSQQSPASPQKHVRLSPRQTAYAPYPSPTYSAAQNLTTTLMAANQHHHMLANSGNSGSSSNTITHQHPHHHHHHHNIIVTQASSIPSSVIVSTSSVLSSVSTPTPVIVQQHSGSAAIVTTATNPNATNHHQQHQQQHQHHSTTTLCNVVGAPQPVAAATIPSTGGGGGGPIASNHRSPLSPNRRTRGENKKCRKVYGMENKDMWCTQCKWKKACSRFGD